LNSIKHPFRFVLLLSIMTITIFSCSTKKNKWTNRTYHATTAKYNILFNGKESYKAGMFDLNKNAKENYTRVLPVYPKFQKTEAQAIAPQMDRTIEKSSKAIKKHSIFIKGKEYNKYIPFAYQIMGEAFFYKQEYETAQRTFNFIINNYKTPDVALEASIWLARTSSELNEMTRADLLFEELKFKFDNSSNKKLKLLFNMAYADFFIKQESYQQAINPVQEALMIKMPKQQKTRLLFILAQLYEKTGSFQAAYDNYKKVIKRNPKYEMSFISHINMAKCISNGTGDKQYVMNILEKLLKDRKNDDFHDVIYYTLAEVALMEPDEPAAIEYLTKSVQTSVNNNTQKAVSALNLADILFKNLNYTLAQRYYDTTITFLPNDYPNYNVIKAKTELLTKLVTNLNVVQTQDSLQRIAKMSESERNRFIDKLIADYNEQERIRQEEERQRQIAIAQANMNRPPDLATAGNWYFYNPSAMAFGTNEFRQKWGDRKLEDNWRISNKQLMTTIDNDPFADPYDDNDDEDTTAKPTDPRNRQTYMTNLPLTEERMKRSHEMIVKALYNAAFIYRDGLKDIPKSNETFESLVQRYPDHKLALQSYFILYQSFSELKNTDKANYYKNIILTKFPDSDYAEIIKDPNYYAKIEERNKAGEILYSKTYTAFQNKNYKTVIQNAQEASTKYMRNDDLMARFDYLKAIAHEHVNGRDSLIDNLEKFIVKYPTNPLTERAQMLLSSKKPDAKTATTMQNTSDTPQNDFIYSQNEFHFYVFIADIRNANINDIKIRISDFNSKFFRMQKFEINSMYLDNTTQMITVSKFDNKTKAMEYFNFIKNHNDVLKDMNTSTIKQYVISDKNYLLYFRNKDLRPKYDVFFNQHYSK
jgi:tetratricopeptide (TPR) repeat protein